MLLYIPPSLTEQRQPLDRAAFVVLKAQAKRLFHARFHVNLYGRRTKQETVAEMITAWSLLDGSEVEPVWDIYTQ
jgi:predicted nucleotidyltransferase